MPSKMWHLTLWQEFAVEKAMTQCFSCMSWVYQLLGVTLTSQLFLCFSFLIYKNGKHSFCLSQRIIRLYQRDVCNYILFLKVCGNLCHTLISGGLDSCGNISISHMFADSAHDVDLIWFFTNILKKQTLDIVSRLEIIYFSHKHSSVSKCAKWNLHRWNTSTVDKLTIDVSFWKVNL